MHKSNGCHTDPKSGNKVASSSVLETNAKLPAVDNLYDVKVASLIECSPCGMAFENLSALEKHLGNFHKKTTRRFDLPTTQGTGHCISEKHAVMDQDEPHQNGDISSDSQQMIKAQEPAPFINGSFKTDCTWCSKEFLCEPVDAETMADASGFMCPRCKDKTWGFFERGLSKSSQH